MYLSNIQCCVKLKCEQLFNEAPAKPPNHEIIYIQYTHVMMYSFGNPCDCLSPPQFSSPLKNRLGVDKRATSTRLPVKTNSCNIDTETSTLCFHTQTHIT